MMKKQNFLLSLLIAASLTGCGSDSSKPNTNTPDPETPEVNEAWNYIETPFSETFNSPKLSGKINVFLGESEEKVIQYINEGAILAQSAGDMSFDRNGDGWINRWDSSDAGVRVEVGTQISTLGSEIDRVLKTNPDGLGAGTARPDIFVEGHYSIFDLLRYLVATRSDMRFDSVTPASESPYKTHEFVLSWDKNGDGDFTNDGAYSKSDLWHYQLMGSNGDAKDYVGSLTFHMYNRMDEYWLRSADTVRFLPTSQAMKGRRTLVWKHEIDKLEANDGKVMVDMLNLNLQYHPDYTPGDGGVKPMPMEIRAFNLRNDVFQPGVIIGMDYFLTAAADYGLDLGFAFWPTLSTGVPFNGFMLSKGPLGHGHGLGGWFGRLLNTTANVLGDFSIAPTCAHMNDQGGPSAAVGGSGSWTLGQEECDRWFNQHNGSGGYTTNTDHYTSVHNYGADMMLLGYQRIIGEDLDPNKNQQVLVSDTKLLREDMGYDQDDCGDEPCDVATLRTLPIATTENSVGNAPLLTETHFGWKIADCTQCHNEERDPLGHGGSSWPVNSADGFDIQQPYYCATCHGNNGAPAPHDYDTRCSFCHNAKNAQDTNYAAVMPNHGEASAQFLLQPEDNRANIDTFSYYQADEPHYEIGQHYVPRAPTALDGEIELYGPMWVPYNNAYTLSKSFPDTYSCLTCHNK